MHRSINCVVLLNMVNLICGMPAYALAFLAARILSGYLTPLPILIKILLEFPAHRMGQLMQPGLVHKYTTQACNFKNSKEYLKQLQ